MFASRAWQDVQLGWDALEDADDQVDRIERALALEPASRVLDVPCGTGRIAARLAARGHQVVGVDVEERFLQEGRERDDGVRYELGDMRELGSRGEFDAVVCFWGSFGYFDDDGNLEQAKAAARSLKPGGRYLIDTVPAETLFADFRAKNWFDLDGSSVLLETFYQLGTGRVETAWTFVASDGSRETHRSSVRVYTVHEVTELLRQAGFSAFRALDDELQDFAIGSSRLWLVATR